MNLEEAIANIGKEVVLDRNEIRKEVEQYMERYLNDFISKPSNLIERHHLESDGDFLERFSKKIANNN